MKLLYQQALNIYFFKIELHYNEKLDNDCRDNLKCFSGISYAMIF